MTGTIIASVLVIIALGVMLYVATRSRGGKGRGGSHTRPGSGPEGPGGIL